MSKPIAVELTWPGGRPGETFASVSAALDVVRETTGCPSPRLSRWRDGTRGVYVDNRKVAMLVAMLPVDDPDRAEG